jgi:hypothetical protein
MSKKPKSTSVPATPDTEPGIELLSEMLHPRSKDKPEEVAPVSQTIVPVTTNISSAVTALLNEREARRLFPEEGLYFNMSEEDYYATAALGATDMKACAFSPSDYWFGSKHNTVLVEEEEEGYTLLLGKAYHHMVLEGREKFERLYGKTVHKGNTKAGIAEKTEIEQSGRSCIKAIDWDRIQLAGAVIRNNEHLSGAFKGGPTEVSIFWNENGVPKRARIDCLKIRANTDLKSIAPRDESGDFKSSCRRHMANYRYDVQALHYNDGRKQIARFVKEGRVFGDHDQDLLKKIAREKEWSSIFVFLKKKGAPLTFGTSLSFENPIFDHSRLMIERAEANYREYRERFGLDAAWLIHEPLEELQFDDLPQWAFRLPA